MPSAPRVSLLGSRLLGDLQVASFWCETSRSSGTSVPRYRSRQQQWPTVVPPASETIVERAVGAKKVARIVTARVT
jgi:hypothetical protein